MYIMKIAVKYMSKIYVYSIFVSLNMRTSKAIMPTEENYQAV